MYANFTDKLSKWSIYYCLVFAEIIALDVTLGSIPLTGLRVCFGINMLLLAEHLEHVSL